MQAPTPKEEKDQIAFVELVLQEIDAGWRFTHIPLGEKRDIRTAMKLKAMGAVKGWPDFQFFGPQRAVFFLELKRRGGRGRLDPAQVGMRDHLLRCGHAYLLTDNLQDALDTMFDLGILRHHVVVSA